MAGSYADFLSTTTAANKGVTNYSSMDAHTASKIAEYELVFTCSTKALNTFTSRAIGQSEDTQKQVLKNLAYPAEDIAYALQAYNNIVNKNTLLEPGALKNYSKQLGNPDESNTSLITLADAKRAVGDNVYLTWKAAGTGDYSRNFTERMGARTQHSTQVPYALNPNYLPDGAETTLSGQAAAVDKDGKVVVGAGTTNAPTNPYLNADGSLNAAAQGVLEQFGLSNVSAPALQEFTAINPLEGKTLSDRGLKTLETLQNSGLAEMLTPEYVKSIIDGYNYIGENGWAAKQGLDQFSEQKFRDLYTDAAEKQNDVLDAQYRAAVNNFYQQLGAQDNILAQELRKAAAQAQASRANAGMAAANQLSAALAQTQNTSKDALEVAQKGIELGEKKAENTAMASRDAFDKYAEIYLSGIDKMNTANSNRAQGGTATMGLAGDLANAEAAADQTTTEAATSTNATNQAAIASKNQANADKYTAQLGAKASTTNAMITGQNDYLNAIANLEANGITFKDGKLYNKDGKQIG